MHPLPKYLLQNHWNHHLDDDCGLLHLKQKPTDVQQTEDLSTTFNVPCILVCFHDDKITHFEEFISESLQHNVVLDLNAADKAKEVLTNGAWPSYNEVQRFSFIDWPKSKCASPLESDETEMCGWYFQSKWQEWWTESFISFYSQHLCASAQCGSGSPNDGIRGKKNTLDKTTWSEASSKSHGRWWATKHLVRVPWYKSQGLTHSLLLQHHHYSMFLPSDVPHRFRPPARSLWWFQKWPGKRPVCHSPPQCDPQPVGSLPIADGNTVKQFVHKCWTKDMLRWFPYYTILWIYVYYTLLHYFLGCCVRSWNRLPKRMEMTIWNPVTLLSCTQSCERVISFRWKTPR